jgi:hypothetical protein
VKELEIRDFSDFESGQIIGAHIPGASVTKTATLLGLSRAADFNVMSIYTNNGKTMSVKRNNGKSQQ